MFYSILKFVSSIVNFVALLSSIWSFVKTVFWSTLTVLVITQGRSFFSKKSTPQVSVALVRPDGQINHVQANTLSLEALTINAGVPATGRAMQTIHVGSSGGTTVGGHFRSNHAARRASPVPEGEFLEERNTGRALLLLQAEHLRSLINVTGETGYGSKPEHFYRLAGWYRQELRFVHDICTGIDRWARGGAFRRSERLRASTAREAAGRN
ncbi:hypothetical protein DL96DRAFT_1720093 [Flagelloscypha sp. PMI_526]|nr:hypothetical protein DL96DRAFT_1720093 [Flagelloscypha sp. PMI_526]